MSVVSMYASQLRLAIIRPRISWNTVCSALEDEEIWLPVQPEVPGRALGTTSSEIALQIAVKYPPANEASSGRGLCTADM